MDKYLITYLHTRLPLDHAGANDLAVRPCRIPGGLTEFHFGSLLDPVHIDTDLVGLCIYVYLCIITDTQLLFGGTGATQDFNNLSFGSLEAKFEEFKKMYLEDKALLTQEMRDIRRQQNDTARQLSKLCLIFHGKSVNDLLQNNKRNLFKPGISLLEKFYGIKIKDYEIHDLHPISKFVRGQLIKAIIVKFNHRHDKSAYM